MKALLLMITFGLSLCELGFAQSVIIEDYKSNQLHLVYGKNHYTGKTDIDANAKLYSDGKKIIIDVTVIDDSLVINDDPINSDHIEIWFSLNSETDNRYLRLKSGKSHFVNIEKDKFVESYNSLTTQPNSEIKEKDKITEDSLVRSTNFYGIVHYGLFPSTKKPCIYDKEYYHDLFLNDTSLKINDSMDGVTYTFQLNDTGYSIHVEFAVEALKFIRVPMINTLNFLIDVIDVDKTQKQEKILSSSSDRKWARTRSFNKVKLKIPVTFNPTDIPERFFKETNVRFDEMLSSENKWIKVIGSQKDEFIAGYRVISDDLILSNNLARYITYRYKQANKFKIEYISCNLNVQANYPNKTYYVINDKYYQNLQGELDSIYQFPNQNTVISCKDTYSCNPYGWGAGGADGCSDEYLHKITNDSIIPLTAISTTGNSSYIHDKWGQSMVFDDQYTMHDYKLLWQNNGEKLIVVPSDLDFNFEITWDKNYHSIIKKVSK